LVAIFTKLDAQIIQEYTKLDDMENQRDKWNKARENADKTFQTSYLSKLLDVKHPPSAWVQLEGKISGSLCVMK